MGNEPKIGTAVPPQATMRIALRVNGADRVLEAGLPRCVGLADVVLDLLGQLVKPGLVDGSHRLAPAASTK